MPKMNRVDIIYIKRNNNISNMCHIAKNLYNEANYIVRQSFINNGKWIRYYELNKLLIGGFNYKILPAQTSQQILMSVDKSWGLFFGAIKRWKRNKNKFISKPGLPKYKKKDGEFMLIFIKQQIRIKDNIIKLPNKIGLEVKTRLSGDTIKGVRIVPQGIGYNLEIVYEVGVPDKNNLNNRMLSIDLGVNNLITAVNNIGEQPIIIKGGIVKSWNQYYNKNKAKLQSIYDRQKGNGTFKLKKLSLKRKEKIKNYFHSVSKHIIKWCCEHNIDTIVIGHNAGWKQNVNIGKRNNQNFVSIPFYVLTNQIKYKAEEKGINIVLQEESYTSKCSFLDEEEICKHDEYMGNRIKRGLFVTNNGTKINADVNGAFNIMKKAFPNAFADGIEGLGVVPRRLSV